MSQTVSAASVVNARSMGGVAASILRGAAQVDFMPSALCGAFFFGALFAAGWQYGLSALLGTAALPAEVHLFAPVLRDAGLLQAPGGTGGRVAPP